MAEARGTAHARAALAGNPSDGHGGAVLAVTIPQLAATVTASDGPADPHEPAILTATRAVGGWGRGRLAHPRLTLDTNIPREVGLAGSSAIVIAALRALHAWHGVEEPPPLELARMALAVETEGLGIAAGPQDRVVQAHGGLVFMDFAGGAWRVEQLDPALLPPLAVVWLRDGGAPSGAWHAALRARPAAEVADQMRLLAAIARTARDALLERDHETFAAALDRTLDIRGEIGPLDPNHEALALSAREVAGCANFTGSGGAIVAVVSGNPELAWLCQGDRARHGLLLTVHDGGDGSRG